MLSVGKVTLWASKRVFRRVFLRGRVFCRGFTGDLAGEVTLEKGVLGIVLGF